MKLWLASYPRSGNTLLRLLLHDVFGITSTSLYESEDGAMRQRPWLMDRIGYAGPYDAAALDAADTWVGVKTHDTPADDAHAIYVVRDGRAAIVSYRHMLRDYANQEVSLSDLIEGAIWPGSWSDHFHAWAPETRANTLMLRFEDIQAKPEACCAEIARFLGVPLTTTFSQQFEELHHAEPTLFRFADNERNIRELKDDEDAFYAHHGALMKRLGYAAGAPS